MSDFALTTPASGGSVGSINRVAGITGALGAPAALREVAVKPANGVNRPGDTVELSEHARFLDKLRQLPDVRASKVAAVQQALVGGSYETDDKLNTAIDRLMEDLGL